MTRLESGTRRFGGEIMARLEQLGLTPIAQRLAQFQSQGKEPMACICDRGGKLENREGRPSHQGRSNPPNFCPFFRRVGCPGRSAPARNSANCSGATGGQK